MARFLKVFRWLDSRNAVIVAMKGNATKYVTSATTSPCVSLESPVMIAARIEDRYFGPA